MSGLDDREVDERFAALVEGWSGTHVNPPYAASPPDAAALPGDPAASDGDAPSGAQARPGEGSPAGAGGSPTEGSAPSLESLGISTWRAPETSWLDVADESFEPPDPTLPPQEDIGYWGAVLGIAGGALLLLWVAIVRPDRGGFWFWVAVTAMLAGFALVVWRLPGTRDPDDTDSGARV